MIDTVFFSLTGIQLQSLILKNVTAQEFLKNHIRGARKRMYHCGKWTLTVLICSNITLLLSFTSLYERSYFPY